MQPMRPMFTLVLLALVMLAGACGGTDEASDPRTEDDAATTTRRPPVTLPDGPAPLSDVDFGLAMIQWSATYAEHGDDLCTLATARLEDRLTPANEMQVQWAASLSRTWHQDVAKALPQHAETVEGTAAAVFQIVSDADWSPEAWSGPDAVRLRTDPAYLAVLDELEAYYAANCVTVVELSPSTTVPAPAPG